ncbi:hypothetical protein BC831DRAFT_279802 [Entophlyctis helioformis]|nr:hypothetical protein BC831DRAFT_279802 [Entophlyctis helioformis]
MGSVADGVRTYERLISVEAKQGFTVESMVKGQQLPDQIVRYAQRELCVGHLLLTEDRPESLKAGEQHLIQALAILRISIPKPRTFAFFGRYFRELMQLVVSAILQPKRRVVRHALSQTEVEECRRIVEALDRLSLDAYKRGALDLSWLEQMMAMNYSDAIKAVAPFLWKAQRLTAGLILKSRNWGHLSLWLQRAGFQIDSTMDESHAAMLDAPAHVRRQPSKANRNGFRSTATDIVETNSSSFLSHLQGVIGSSVGPSGLQRAGDDTQAARILPSDCETYLTRVAWTYMAHFKFLDADEVLARVVKSLELKNVQSTYIGLQSLRHRIDIRYFMGDFAETQRLVDEVIDVASAINPESSWTLYAVGYATRLKTIRGELDSTLYALLFRAAHIRAVLNNGDLVHPSVRMTLRAGVMQIMAVLIIKNGTEPAFNNIKGLEAYLVDTPRMLDAALKTIGRTPRCSWVSCTRSRHCSGWSVLEHICSSTGS